MSWQHRCGFKRVPPGLWLGKDSCIFQQYLPDSGPMRDSNSQAKVKKKKVEMSASTAGGGEVPGRQSEETTRTELRRLLEVSQRSYYCF